MKAYVLVYCTRTDDEMKIEAIEGGETLKHRIEELGLTRWDYALLDGVLIKDFDQQVDLGSLR